MRKTLIVAALLGLGISATSTIAATTNCGSITVGTDVYDLNTFVTPNSGCEIGSSDKDNGPDANISNTDAFFGFTDWTNIDRDESVGDASNPSGFSLAGDTMSGLWNLIDTSYADYMFIFKGGQSNIIGYLLDGTSGSYQSPLFNTGNSMFQDISHITLYGRGTPGGGGTGPGAVPLPAGLPMLLGALGLGAFIARRRKS